MLGISRGPWRSLILPITAAVLHGQGHFKWLARAASFSLLAAHPTHPRSQAPAVHLSSGDRPIFLVGATRNDLKRIIRRCRCSTLASSHPAHPNVALLISGEDGLHRLWMNRRYHRVRCGGEKAVDEVRAGDGFRLRPAIALELGPDPGERHLREAPSRLMMLSG